MLYADTRLGGVTQWVYGNPRDAMRIPKDFLNCVCYLCIKDARGWQYGGTGFFASVPSESDKNENHVYLVTARHSITKIQKLGYDAYLRVNTHGGGAEFIKVNSEWFYPEADAVDVAVLPIDPPFKNYHIVCLDVAMFVNRRLIKDEEIGVGDELMITGLFSMRQGTDKNIPIIRSGIIASMPDEPLRDNASGGKYDAYLAEVRSIGGLSGSPVFVVISYLDKLTITYYLLGLIRGHWDFPKSAELPAFNDELSYVNMGIATVTPAQEVLKILQSKALKKYRRRLDRQRAAERAPTPDHGF